MEVDGRPVLVISPHLDDAVLACGQLLAQSPGSVVVTVLAGSPESGTDLTEWDAAGGFRPGDEVMAARRAEDRAALAHLGARPVWLDFLDAQYGASPGVAEVAQRLEAEIEDARCERVFMPLGLFHSDHHLTHEACLVAAHRDPEREWLAYEEPSYRHISGLVQDRLTALSRAGVDVTLAHLSRGEIGLAEKRRALAEYRSQLRALTTPGRPGYANAFEPERYWRLRLSAAVRSRRLRADVREPV